jgi:hypothetical protein
LPESRSSVFIDEVPGDFSDGGTLTPLILAVRLEIEGSV